MAISLSLGGSAPAEAAPANTIHEMFAQLNHCLHEANAYSDPEFEVTIVFSVRRDGSVFGKPRISYAKFSGDDKERASDLAAVIKGLDQCTPLSITDALGGAIAGRQIAFRFGPKLREDGA
jgi:hypothetical protein